MPVQFEKRELHCLTQVLLTPLSPQTLHADLGQGAKGPSLLPGRHWGSS